MNTTIYATILTGLGIVVTLIVAIHNMMRANQQETNRRIDDTNRRIDDLKLDNNRRMDELRQDTIRQYGELRQDMNKQFGELRQDMNKQFGELRQDVMGAIDSKSKVNEAQFEVVGVRFRKLEEDLAEVRQEVQDIKKVIFKNAA